MEIDTLAEVVHSFVDWVDAHARNLPYPIYFLSRDGNIFKKLSKTNSQFMWVSRSALWKSSMFSENDIYDYLNRYFGYLKKGRIYNMFHIEENDDSQEIINEKNVFPFIEKYSNQILKASIEHKKRLDKYLKNNDLKNKKIILVDVGYGATTQYLLSKHGVHSTGFYLATNNYNFHHIDTSNISTRGFLIEKRNDTHLFHLIMKNTNWLESIFIGDLMNTVNDFDEKGNPVYCVNSFTPEQLKVMIRYHNYIVNYPSKKIKDPPQKLYEFLTSNDFNCFSHWDRGKIDIRKSGLNFQPVKVLFLSPDNIAYCRFAESCFNDRISRTSLAYMGDSGKYRIQNDDADKPGLELLDLLKSRNINYPSMYRKFETIDNRDLEFFDQIIIIGENSEGIARLNGFARYREKIEYWNQVNTVHSISASAQILEIQVSDLIDRLKPENIPNPVDR